jgi:hypothetical protein
MKMVMVLLVALSLFVAVGCNYDYGKYGKEKTESTSEQKNTDGATSN